MIERAATPVPRVLGLCLHVLTAALLVLAIARATLGPPPRLAAVVAVAIVVGAIYGAGPAIAAIRRSTAVATGWLALLMAAWMALLALTPDGIWLAFPLFFVQLHLLPARWALVAVSATAVVAIAGFGWHQGALAPGTVIGPLLGAAVAVATALGYQTLYRESERRRQLVEELTAMRTDLTAAEHAAGVLAERERLAREIHDTLAQGLSSIQLLLTAAERAMPADAQAADHVRLARRTAQDNLMEARRFVLALTPPALDGDPLPTALGKLCATATAEVSDLSVHFHLSGTPTDLPTAHEVALLRVAQSALANTTQHARATRAEVTLSYMDTEIALDVVDDGRGFDPRTLSGAGTGSTRRGFGLAAMRARIRAIAGNLTIESAPGHGTAIAVTLPYGQPS